MLDGPFAILCMVMVPGGSHCPHRVLGLQPPSPGRKESTADWHGPHRALGLCTVLEPLVREMSIVECARVPGQNTPKSSWMGQMGRYGAPLTPWGLPGYSCGAGISSISPLPQCHRGEPSLTWVTAHCSLVLSAGAIDFSPVRIATQAGNEKINLAARKAFCSFNMQLKCDGKRHCLAMTATFPASIKLAGAVLSGSSCQAARTPS